jgi:uroporphyrin-III C-methyltransferase
MPDGFVTQGFVTLCGAGPGGADHLTLGALKALQGAEAVLYDALVSDEIIALLPQRCVKVCVGKRGDRLSVPQDRTNALMVRLARRGLNVVRLKGGDPSVFGRVEEERLHLDRHGVAHRTLPGVTAASAAAAQFEFPLTHRGEARSVTFLTGRGQDGSIDFRDGLLADPSASLCFYMSSHNAAHIQASLLRVGRSAATPVMAVENAGRDTARVLRGCLANLADMVAEAAWDGPVLLGVGAAFAYARLPHTNCADPTLTLPLHHGVRLSHNRLQAGCVYLSERCRSATAVAASRKAPTP